MAIKTLKEMDVSGKKVLLRVDINAPVLSGKIMDGPRFQAAAKTINELIKRNAKIVILAHQGRSGGDDFLPLEQHARMLSKYTSKPVKYVDSLFEEKAKLTIASLSAGECILLKNVRAYDDELNVKKQNNEYYEFSRLFEVYVNDAFSVSHREQGSIIIPPENIQGCIGPDFQEEISAIKKFLAKKHAKNVFLIGGQKVEDYLPLFEVLKNKNNVMLVSGVLANLILVSQGSKLGYENIWLSEKGYDKLIPKIKSIYEKYESQIILPVDFAVGHISGKSEREEIDALDFPTQQKIWDVGHQTVEDFKSYIQDAKTIFMKGPLGYSELPQYSYGTVEVLKAIAKSKAFSLLGGGHLTTAIKEYKIKDKFGYISNAGGALIAYISGEKLPGIESLTKSHF